MAYNTVQYVEHEIEKINIQQKVVNQGMRAYLLIFKYIYCDAI